MSYAGPQLKRMRDFELTYIDQGMVLRSELTAAESEAKATKEELEAKARDLEWVECQMYRTQEQLNSVRAEAAQLQLAISGMVPKSELFATRADCDNLREAILELQGAMRTLNDEKSDLVQKMQVHFRLERRVCFRFS
jgi:predicted  nucleic acid-binding Zn-ribbon protein